MAKGFYQNKVSLLKINGFLLVVERSEKHLKINDLWDVPAAALERTERQEGVKIMAPAAPMAAINSPFLTGWEICHCPLI